MSENQALTNENYSSYPRKNTTLTMLQALLVYLLTDWPWETAKYINAVEPRRRNFVIASSRWRVCRGCSSSRCTKCFTKLLRLLFTSLLIIFLRLLPVCIGYVSQLMTCFRRDYPYFHWVLLEDPNSHHNVTTQYCQLKCKVNKEFVTGLLIPDAVLVTLSVWVYCILKFGYPLCQRFGCKGFKAVLKADTTECLNKLIKEVKPELLRKPFVKVYTVIPVGYIVSSQLLSIFYLFAFGVTGKNVVIQSPIASSVYANLSQQRHINITILISSFLGFIAFDLLYVRVIMRYAYRSQLIIYYLESIKRQIKQDQENVEIIIQEKIKKVYKFLKQLNASSATTGFVILITGFAAISCVINLLNTTSCPIHSLDEEGNARFSSMQLMQVLAMAIRLILWTFLTLFPFHKAAEVNVALRKLGLAVHTPKHHAYINCHHRLNYITLKARLVGIPVHPWLPYVVVILLLITIMIGSNITLYEHLL